MRPAIAELVEVGKDGVPQDALKRVGTQESIKYGVRADVVEFVKRVAQLRAERGCRWCPASVICWAGGVGSAGGSARASRAASAVDRPSSRCWSMRRIRRSSSSP